MNYLLDTHIFIWWVEGDQKIGADFKKIIGNSDGNIYISLASIWEMVIKKSLGKLKLKKPLDEIVENSKFRILGIELPHILGIMKLPSYHKDPFDRMLIAQALTEKMTLITVDVNIKKYKVPILE
jgi:PIN domain nuclease of toxin-antitoxin system